MVGGYSKDRTQEIVSSVFFLLSNKYITQQAQQENT